MQRISLVELAQQHIKTKLRPGDIAIDATVGNGHDTGFLLAQVSPSGHVYGFDIQASALAAVESRLGVQDRLSLIAASHAEMAAHIPERLHGTIRACMFNLGYLPGGDKQIITRSDSTLAALAAACALLSADGIITVVAYPGHMGGDVETKQVNAWCRLLDTRHYRPSIIDSQPDNASAPKLFVVEKTVAVGI